MSAVINIVPALFTNKTPFKVRVAPVSVIPADPEVVKSYKLVAPLILMLAAVIVPVLVALAVPESVLFITTAPAALIDEL